MVELKSFRPSMTQGISAPHVMQGGTLDACSGQDLVLTQTALTSTGQGMISREVKASPFQISADKNSGNGAGSLTGAGSPTGGGSPTGSGFIDMGLYQIDLWAQFQETHGKMMKNFTQVSWLPPPYFTLFPLMSPPPAVPSSYLNPWPCWLSEQYTDFFTISGRPGAHDHVHGVQALSLGRGKDGITMVHDLGWPLWVLY